MARTRHNGLVEPSKPSPKASRKFLSCLMLSIAGFLLAVSVLWGFFASALRGDLEVYQKTSSPDGRYIATLYYRNGMTTGYYFVSLEPTGTYHLPFDYSDPPTKVAEVAEEGLDGVAWQDSKTLIVKYVAGGSPVYDADFVTQSQQWHGVRIKYQPVKPRT